MSIKKKLFVFLVIIMIIPTTYFAYFSYTEAKEGMISLAQEQMVMIAHSALDQVRSYLEFQLREDPSILQSETLLSSFVEKPLGQMKISKGSYIFIINHSGVVLHHPDREKKVNRVNFKHSSFESLRRITDRIISEKSGFGEFRDEDGAMFVYFVDYEQGNVLAGSSLIEPRYMLDWSLGVVVPQDHVLSKANRILYLFAIVSSFCLILFLAIGYALINVSFVKPILRLAYTMENLGENFDCSVKFQTVANDEIGLLYSGFNKMIKQICENQKDLASLRNYLSNIINSMPSVIIGVDSQGKITQWNYKAEIYSGIKAENALGQVLVDVYPFLESYKGLIKECIDSNEIQVSTKQIRTVDGDVCFDDLTIYPLITNGVVGAVIRIDDVTERVRLEEMMVQTEKMMSVGGLAAGMAHEINNPLSSIIQGIQNIQRRFSAEVKANNDIAKLHNIELDSVHKYMEERSINDFLEGIKDAGIRSAEIVKNMLDFSRQSETVLKEEDVVSIIENTLEIASHDYNLRKKYDFKKINIIKIYSTKNLLIKCVKSEIEQVLLNLFKNGAEIMSDKLVSIKSSGIYEITESSYQPTFKIKTYQKNMSAFIEVEDNGPGMSNEVAKRVFDPFFTTKPPGVGTGLGLSVSYFIVTQKHNGKMWVEATEGNGVKFVIALPLSRV